MAWAGKYQIGSVKELQTQQTASLKDTSMFDFEAWGLKRMPTPTPILCWLPSRKHWTLMGRQDFWTWTSQFFNPDFNSQCAHAMQASFPDGHFVASGCQDAWYAGFRILWPGTAPKKRHIFCRFPASLCNLCDAEWCRSTWHLKMDERLAKPVIVTDRRRGWCRSLWHLRGWSVEPWGQDVAKPGGKAKASQSKAGAHCVHDFTGWSASFCKDSRRDSRIRSCSWNIVIRKL